MQCDPVTVFQAAVTRVPAYRSFLEAHASRIPEVHSLEAFSTLPLCDKKSYIAHYPLEDLCLDGSLRGKHVIVRSSGSTTTPFYWPQVPDQERDVTPWLYAELDEVLHVSDTPTLVIVALGLGSWISGELATWSLRTLAMEHENLTLVTPGLDVEEVVNLLERFAPRFPQTLIYSYPPFARMMVDRAMERGVKVADLGIHLRLAGEGYSEHYRDHLNRLLGYEEGHLSSMLSGYASTDFGRCGKETPMAVLVKRLLHEKGLTQQVLGSSDIPTVCQFNAAGFYLETVDGEIVITKLQAVPLVRYRTGDRGEIVPFEEMMARFARLGIDPLAELERRGFPRDTVKPLPFLLVSGRTDGGITFYGANIAAALVRDVLETASPFREQFTPRFQVRKREDQDSRPVFEILVEPREDGQACDPGALAACMAEELSRRSNEYAVVLHARGDAALPLMTVVPRGHLLQGAKIRYVATS